MSKEEFIKLLEKSKKDRYGNLYIEEKDVEEKPLENKRRWYFGLLMTVCDDLVKEYCGQDAKNNFEIYDRHSWNDDTLEIKIINNGNPKERKDY